MKIFEKPSLEFVLFGEENIIAASCATFNCQNPIGYGDLCAGQGGHDYCGSHVDPCPNDTCLTY